MAAVSNTQLVFDHVKEHAKDTFRPAAGALNHPYLVPFTGIAVVPFGGAEYFKGSMLNFFTGVDLSTGEVKGCLTPAGASKTLYHAKPILIQGAYLSAKADGGSFDAFKPLAPAMHALLRYWHSGKRYDAATGLHVWYDQMESGADDLVYSDVASGHTPGWTSEEHGFRISSPDIMTFLYREHAAFAAFLAAWGSPAAEIAEQHAAAESIKKALNQHLWHWDDVGPSGQREGWYAAYDVAARRPVLNRTYQMAWPLWAGLAETTEQTEAAVRAVLAPDMWTPWGIRSTSARDPRYNNENIIVPYSNWKGPIWINVNCILAYALARSGHKSDAIELANRIVKLLADDLRNGGAWHECYHAETGTALAAPGFLSWNTLSASLQANLAADIDPTAI